MVKKRRMSRELTRVRPDVDDGIRRVRAGKGFRYLHSDGSLITDVNRERIRQLAIPPAWTEVWIAPEPHGHIQAVGVDDAGRKQYIYHPDWTRRRDRSKFARALRLAGVLAHARSSNTRALRGSEGTREVALAVAFRILDSAAPRVGSTVYLQRYGSRGLTTLRRGDVTIEGSRIDFSFPAKSGQRSEITIDDTELASTLTQMSAGRPRSPLLWFWDGRRQSTISASELNAYIRNLVGAPFTAKDFRTLQATAIAAATLARIGRVDSEKQRRAAIDLAVQAAADHLGNTRAVARSSYIDPRVLRAYERGDLLDLSVGVETALVRLLEPNA